jgi:hypothetical protein
VDRQAADVGCGVVEPVEQGPQRPQAAIAGHLQGERLVVSRRRAEGPGRRFQLVRVGELQPDVPAGDAALELLGGALGDDPALIEDRDPVGELIGLVQVLGGEEDRYPVGGETADDLPHGTAATRVEPGGRLVEEDQARVADQGHREVQPAPHAPRISRGCLACHVGQVKAVQQGRGAPSGLGPAQAVQVRHQEQVLLAGEKVVDRRELAGDADRGADRVGVVRQVVAGDAHLAAIGADQGGQDVHHGGLPGAVGAEQREDRPFGDGEVDAIKHHLVAERLPQSGRRNRRPGGGEGCHRSSLNVRCGDS